jgi:hypothetical protein
MAEPWLARSDIRRAQVGYKRMKGGATAWRKKEEMVHAVCGISVLTNVDIDSFCRESVGLVLLPSAHDCLGPW